MLDDHLEQLKSTNPEARRAAIVALGRSKDPAALQALANISRSDPDPELRDLARKAGRYIRQQTAEAPATSPEAGEAEQGEITVTAADKERAMGYINQALDFHVRRNDIKAAEQLGRAFAFNPKLRDDTVAANLAADITGLDSEIAVRILSDPDERRQFILSRGGKLATSTVRRRDVEEATWNDVLIDLSIYGLANAAVVFVISVVSFQSLVQALAYASSGGVQVFSPDLLPAAGTIGLPLAALYGIIYGMVAIFLFFIQGGAIHLIAATIMGGDGTLPGLFRKITLFYTVVVPISAIISFAPFLIQNEDLLAVFGVASLLFSLFILIWSGRLVGKAYDFGTGKGCLSIFLGSLMLGIAVACCVLTLGGAIAQLLSGSVQAAGF